MQNMTIIFVVVHAYIRYIDWLEMSMNDCALESVVGVGALGRAEQLGKPPRLTCAAPTREAAHASMRGANTTSDWTVVGRRSVPNPVGRRSVPTPIGRRSVPTPIGRRSVPNLSHTPGQCAKCGETNHVTATCRHAQKVVCRKCGESGHKDKHRPRD